ncbi:MAG: hypothetical protein DLD55_06110 [candidate division SR1 bacterium]|nr:MAG: hypothetical protein DLD55_06110 [candidate division SR1 bacterium]
MRKRILTIISLWISFAFVIAGCGEKLEKGEFSEYGLIAYPNGIITLKDFEEAGKLWKTVEEFRQTFSSLEENPIVPLIFHKDGSLYTADEYNRLAEQWEAHLFDPHTPAPEADYYGDEETFGVTDIESFRKITSWSMVDKKYALDGMFDPYQKYYETEEERK